MWCQMLPRMRPVSCLCVPVEGPRRGQPRARCVAQQGLRSMGRGGNRQARALWAGAQPPTHARGGLRGAETGAERLRSQPRTTDSRGTSAEPGGTIHAGALRPGSWGHACKRATRCQCWRAESPPTRALLLGQAPASGRIPAGCSGTRKESPQPWKCK